MIRGLINITTGANNFMKAIICITMLTSFALASHSQSANYKDSIDILVNQTRKGNKVYHDKDTAGKRHYFFSKTKKQIVGIVFAPTASHSAYQYDFINNELAKIVLYLPYTLRPESRGKPMSAVYYFRDGLLADKVEINFPEVNIEYYKQIGIELHNRAMLFLKIKGIN